MIKEYRREIALAIVAYLIFAFLYQWEGLSPFLSGLLTHIIIILLSIFIAFAFALYVVHKEISILLEQDRLAKKKVRKPLALFMSHRLKALQEVRTALTSGGFDLDKEELEIFVDACFSANDGRTYAGTDSNVPTRFYELYSAYLGKQFMEERLQRPGHDVRIIFASLSDLSADFKKDKITFSDFIENHWTKHVRLLQVEKDVATQLAQNQRLPSTDLGIFGGKFVAFFHPYQNGTAIKYRIQLKALTAERRSQLQQYMHMLNMNAKEIRLENEVVYCDVRDSAKKEEDELRLLWALTDSPWRRIRLARRSDFR